MATAREQAREAVTTKFDIWSSDREQIADAVSDVWEPLVREAIALVDINGLHDGHWAPGGCAICTRIDKLKRALG